MRGKPAVLKAGRSYGLTASRPCALRGLIFNQAPVAGRCSAQITSGGKGTSSGYRSRRSAPTGNVPVR